MKHELKSRRTRRGVIGIESAIVMIAFVIVAAALAFVVLNMGFSTTQKAKTAISSSVTESSSALEIAGKVTGFGYISGAVTERHSYPSKGSRWWRCSKSRSYSDRRQILQQHRKI